MQHLNQLLAPIERTGPDYEAGRVAGHNWGVMPANAGSVCRLVAWIEGRGPSISVDTELRLMAQNDIHVKMFNIIRGADHSDTTALRYWKDNDVTRPISLTLTGGSLKTWVGFLDGVRLVLNEVRDVLHESKNVATEPLEPPASVSTKAKKVSSPAP